MPEFLEPGVYIEEVASGSKPIEGVSTSTTAFIGAAKKGPVLEPTLVTNWNQFEPLFGDFTGSPGYLAYAVDAYFRNGGKTAYIVRVAGSADCIQGLASLEKVEGISLLAVPGETSQAVQQAMIDHCKKMRYRFAILDPAFDAKVSGTGSVKEQRNSLVSGQGFAALYYPWIQAPDPVSKEPVYLPPSGAIAGMYACTDREQGVHKAPANGALAGVVSLKTSVTQSEQEELNQEGINVIRFFPGRGIRVWGARTVAGGVDPLWKYVNIRRLLMFLEESIERATRWVVFEPNNEKLWIRVRAAITEFLTRVWRDGALMGTKAEEAFFVKCDRTTMTQDDIDNGRLICLIGAAPVKPAEFVIFRIAQCSGGAHNT